MERISEILRLVFDLLWFEPQGLYATEIMRYFRSSVPLSEFETGYYSFAPHSPRYEVIIRVGTIPLVRAGWMEKTKKGRWFITDAGRQACKRYKRADDFFKESVRLFQEWKEEEDNRLARLSSDPYNHAFDNSWEQIRHYIDSLDIVELRTIVGALLKALGCHIVWSANTGQNESGDILDLICYSDSLGLSSPRVLVHITKMNQISTVEGLTWFMRLLQPGEVGIYISFGGMTNSLKDFALTQTQKRIRLIDLENFVELWIENIEKINQEDRAKLPLKPVYFLFFPERL